MCYNCTMTSPKNTSPEEGADVDGVERDGAEWEEGVVESDYCDVTQ